MVWFFSYFFYSLNLINFFYHLYFEPHIQDYNLREKCNELFDFITLPSIQFNSIILYIQFNSIMAHQALPQYIVTKQNQPEGPFMKTKEKGEI
jgi:hypothetical protein